MNWYFEVLKKYAVFNGRARRKEYWFFLLFNVIASMILGFADGMIGSINPESGMGLLGGIYTLAVLVPGIAVTVRRLHDTGRSGWWILIGLIPLLGAIVLLIFMVQDSKPGENQYGENPKSTPLLSADSGSDKDPEPGIGKPSEKKPVLQCLSGEYQGATLELGGTPLVMGTNRESCHLIFSTREISRRHCSLQFDEAGKTFRLEDTGSTNGTYLSSNGTRINPGQAVILNPDDEFYLSDPSTSFQVTLEDVHAT